MRHIVGVSDMKTGVAGDTIITHALGSCLGLMIYDPVAKVGGLLHAMLPLSKTNPEKAKNNPHMFVDIGVPALFKAVFALGGKKDRLIIKAAGCGQPLGDEQLFQIGSRNFTVLKQLLWKNNLMLASSAVGGGASRTVKFDISSGEMIISSQGVETLL